MNAQSKEIAAEQFSKWLAVTHPELFLELFKRAKGVEVSASQKLSGLMDVLGSVGSSVASAVSNVGSYLTSSQGLQTIGTLATSYMNNQAQQSVLSAQLARMQAGQNPMPVTYTTQTAVGSDGQPYTTQVPVLQTAPGQFQYVTPQSLQQATPASLIKQYWPFLAIGGALLLLWIMLSTRRQ